MAQIDPVADALVGEWLSLSEVAVRLNIPTSRVKQLLRDRKLVAVVRPGGDRSVPAAFLDGGQIVKGLCGTLTVLFDCGTPRVFEEASYKYVFRTRPHATMDAVGAALLLAELSAVIGDRRPLRGSGFRARRVACRCGCRAAVFVERKPPLGCKRVLVDLVFLRHVYAVTAPRFL